LPAQLPLSLLHQRNIADTSHNLEGLVHILTIWATDRIIRKYGFCCCFNDLAVTPEKACRQALDTLKNGLCGPYSAMALAALASCLAKAFVLSLFRRRQVFDISLGKFVHRSKLSANQEQSMG